MDKKLKDALITNIKLHLLKEDWKYIDYMMSEMYKVRKNGMDMIVIKPLPSAFHTMEFYAINGAFAGDVVNWEQIQSEGTPI